MRLELVKKSNADNTCLLTKCIFLRIAIEASLEQWMDEKPELTLLENNQQTQLLDYKIIYFR